MGREGFIPLLHMQAQGDLPARRRCVVITNLPEVSGHQGEQIGGLGEGVIPRDRMTISADGFLLNRIAIAQQHRAAAAAGLNPHLPAAQHIRTIRVQADAPESLGLALGAQQTTTGVQAFERTVGVGIQTATGFQHKRLVRNVGDGETSVGKAVVLWRQRRLVDHQGFDRQINAAQHQGLSRPTRFKAEPGGNDDMVVLDVHVQDDGREFKGPRRVVRQTNRSSCSHGRTTRGPNDPDGRRSKPGRFSQAADHQASNGIRAEEQTQKNA